MVYLAKIVRQKLLKLHRRIAACAVGFLLHIKSTLLLILLRQNSRFKVF